MLAINVLPDARPNEFATPQVIPALTALQNMMPCHLTPDLSGRVIQVSKATSAGTERNPTSAQLRSNYRRPRFRHCMCSSFVQRQSIKISCCMMLHIRLSCLQSVCCKKRS